MSDNRIVITGDLTRVNDSMELHQAKNIDWFSRIFAPIFEELGYTVETVGREGNEASLRALRQSLYDVGSGDLQDQWASYYDSLRPHKALSEFVTDLGPALFLLFEASPSMMAAIDDAGHMYLNFRVHPIRFAADLVFAVKTNRKHVAQNLRRFSMPRHFVSREVNLCRQRWRTSGNSLPRGSTIFMAQTSQDASLIERSKFLRIEDFTDKLLNIVDRSRPIFYRPHPVERQQRSLDLWTSLFPSTTEASAGVSTYELFCQSDDLRIVTISSGSGYEAALFGHSASYLSSRYWGGCYYEDYVPISHEYWYPPFWEDIFTKRGIVGSALHSLARNSSVEHDLPFVEGRLRTLINFQWSRP